MFSLEECNVPLPCKCYDSSTKVNEHFYETINCILDRQYKFQHVCKHTCLHAHTCAHTYTHTYTHKVWNKQGKW